MNTDDNSGSAIPHLKLVSRVALAASLLAGLVLGFVIVFITDEGGVTYGEIIQSANITRQQLGPALLVAGLILIAITGLITWLVCLYSSFRVAGPLYRFSHNLEIASGSSDLPGIRSDDSLQDVSQQLISSAGTVRDHYGELRKLADQALRELDAPETAARANFAHTVVRLKEQANRARINEQGQ